MAFPGSAGSGDGSDGGKSSTAGCGPNNETNGSGVLNHGSSAKSHGNESYVLYLLATTLTRERCQKPAIIRLV
jgi:hypothetical protein